METRAQNFDSKVLELFPSGEFVSLEDHFIGKWQIKGSCFCLALPGRIVLGNLMYHKGLYTIEDDSISIDLQNISPLTNALCQLKSKNIPQQVFYKVQDDEGNILTLHLNKEGSTTSIYFQMTKNDSRIVHIDVSSQLDNTILAIYNAMILATCPNAVEERTISCLLDVLGEQDVDFADILTKCWRDTPEEKTLFFASQKMVKMYSITPQDENRVYWYIKSNAGRMFDFLRLKRLVGRSWTKQGS